MEFAGNGFVTVLAIVFFSTVLILRTLYKRKSTRYNSSIPSGSFGWPVVGETIGFLTSAISSNPHSFVEKRIRRHGKVFKSHLFGRKVVVSADSEVNRYILKNEGEIFAAFWPKSVADLLGKSSLLVINGSMHKRLHGMIAAFFKTSNFKAQFTVHYYNSLQRSMATWKDDHGVHIQKQISRIALEALAKRLINLDPGEDMDYFKAQLEEVNAGFNSIPINLPGTRLYKSLQAKEKLVKFVQKIIDARRKIRDYKADPDIAEDLTDVFLKGDCGSDEMICHNMVNTMANTQDSLPIFLAHAINYLSNCPPALQEITEENINFNRSLKEKGMEEPFAWTDYLSLPFTQCVISETLRLGNIASGVMREATKDVEINGYFIPKGWCIMADFRSIHLDKDVHDSPLQFNPWRWQGKHLSSMVSTSAFSPFSGGQRLCVGYELARLQASIFLHHFITNFSWVPEKGASPISKEGMTVRVKRRTDH